MSFAAELLPSYADRVTLAQAEIGATRSWLLRAPPGAKRVYHEGHLEWDRAPGRGGDKAANAIANLLYWAERQSLVLLVQERVAPGVCRYVAYRTAVQWNVPLPVLSASGKWQHTGNDAAMGVT